MSSKPKVVVFATGGTIAGVSQTASDASYESGKVSVDDLIAAVPEASEIAELQGVQISSIGSQDMNDVVWMKLAAEVDRWLADDSVSGVVITHGTDTMEETAYFLNLVVDSQKPVVFTGAMRPSTALSADGPLNLFNSVAVAASPKANGHGVMLVADDFIHGAREVSKSHTLTVQAFESPNLGLLGAPQKVHTSDSVFSIKAMEELPRIDVVYAHSNMKADQVRAAVDCGAKGIVLAGVGNGNASAIAIEALAQAAKQGVVVVRSTRSSSGAVLRNKEINDDEFGFVVSDQLNPSKARVLLQLGLTQTSEVGQIQEYFWTY